MGGFDEKIRKQPCALESGFVRTRQRLLLLDFFIIWMVDGFGEKIRRLQPLPGAHESGFERKRLFPDFFIKSPHFVLFGHLSKKVSKAHRLFDHENVIFGVK